MSAVAIIFSKRGRRNFRPLNYEFVSPEHAPLTPLVSPLSNLSPCEPCVGEFLVPSLQVCMKSENIESFRHLLYNTRHRNSKENSRFEDINRGDDNIICSRLFLLYWLFSKSNRKLFLNFLDEFEYIYIYIYMYRGWPKKSGHH